MRVDEPGSGRSTVPPNPTLEQRANEVADSHAPGQSMNSTKIGFPLASVEMGTFFLDYLESF